MNRSVRGIVSSFGSPSLAARFLSRIEPEKNGECLLWTGAFNDDGYGYIRTGGRQSPMLRVHRLSMLLMRGIDSGEFEVNHICRVRACVNPYHLEIVGSEEHHAITRRFGGAPLPEARGDWLDEYLPREFA